MTGPCLTRAVLLAALADAAQCRRERLTGHCHDCASAGDGQHCPDHETDLRAAEAYQQAYDEMLGTITREEIAQLRKDAFAVRNTPLAMLCGRALRGDAVAWTKAAAIVAGKGDSGPEVA